MSNNHEFLKKINDKIAEKYSHNDIITYLTQLKGGENMSSNLSDNTTQKQSEKNSSNTNSSDDSKIGQEKLLLQFKQEQEKNKFNISKWILILTAAVVLITMIYIFLGFSDFKNNLLLTILATSVVFSSFIALVIINRRED